ncbi:MAG: hypothetical protein HW378_2839, partial [Anaerolineales bacterium]|nr:hypothetical protein [Anaerolineales bacterium]
VVDLGHLVTYDPTPPFDITATNRPPGRYYISIYTGSGYNSTTPYSLTATFP